MKKRFYFPVILFICMISILTSCDEGRIFSQSEQPAKLETTAQESYTIMATLPREIRFSVNSNTPWTIKSSEPWCEASPAFSAVSSLIADVTVVTEINESTSPRSAMLTITGENVESHTITIHQDGRGNLEVTKIDETDAFDTDGGTKDFYIVSNKDWTISTSATWLTVDKEEGQGNENEKITIQVTAAANTATKRTGTITVRNGLEELAFNVVQNGVLFEMTNVDDVNFSGATEFKEYELTSNIGWSIEVTGGEGWLTVSPEGGRTSALITISAANNTTLKPRSAQVTVKPDAEAIEGYVLEIFQDILQDGTFRYDFTQGNAGIYATGGVTFDENGARILMPAKAKEDVWGRERFEQYGSHKKGVFTWKFSLFNIPSNSSTWFDLNAWESNSGNYHLFLNGKDKSYISTSFGTYDEASFDNTFDLTTLKSITVIVDDDPNNIGKLRLELFFNGDKVAEVPNLNNLYAENPGLSGPTLYYGLMYEGGDEYRGEVVLEYFQKTPFE